MESDKRQVGIKEFLYPENIKCIVCENELFDRLDIPVCDECARKIFPNEKFCKTCGRGNNNLAEYCDYCAGGTEWYFDNARSAFNYDGELKGLVYGFKYGDKQYLAKHIAKYLSETLTALKTETNTEFDLITFVPLHKKRLKKRGYNQSELLAKELSKISEMPCVNTLEKIKSTKNMAKLKADERKLLIKDSFVVSGSIIENLHKIRDNLSKSNSMRDITDKILGVTAKKPLKDFNVLLIDDIFTTGATANECAKMIKAGGAKNISVLTFASLPIPIVLI